MYVHNIHCWVKITERLKTNNYTPQHCIKMQKSRQDRSVPISERVDPDSVRVVRDEISYIIHLLCETSREILNATDNALSLYTTKQIAALQGCGEREQYCMQQSCSIISAPNTWFRVLCRLTHDLVHGLCSHSLGSLLLQCLLQLLQFPFIVLMMSSVFGMM